MKTVSSSKDHQIQKMIPLNVDKDEWMRAVQDLKKRFSICEGTKKDEVSSRRIAILLGELFLQFKGDFSKVPIIEKDAYDLALEYRLVCEPLERELRVKNPSYRRQILNV